MSFYELQKLTLYPQKISDNSRLCSEGFTSYGLTANSQKDIKAKILEDPLYAMKKKEQDMIQSLLDNKYKLKQIKREIDGKDTLQKYAKQSSKRSRRHHLREKSSPLECHGSRRHGYKTASKRHYRRERSRKC